MNRSESTFGDDERPAESFAVGTCPRHVHLSRVHLDALFGKDHALVSVCTLVQPHEAACMETVKVKGPSGSLPNVRVVGPVAAKTQVELSLRDCERIGLERELRLSRETSGSVGCVLEGPAGTVVLAEGVINALRHLRVSPTDANRLNLSAGNPISVRVNGERSRILHDVVVSVEPGCIPELCLDTDDAAAVELGPTTRATIETVANQST